MTTMNSKLVLYRYSFLFFWSLLFLGWISPASVVARTDYPSVRASILALQAAQIGTCPRERERQKRCILLGDSITDGFYVHSLAGYEVFNAGIGSARVSNLYEVASKLVQASGIQVAILCIGVNDANREIEFSATEWEYLYRNLCQDIARYVSVLYVQTIFPVEEKKPLGDSYFDSESIRIMNDCIRNIASQEGYILIDAFNAFSTAEGFMQEGGTVDGVHPSPVTYSRWQKLLEDSLDGRGE